MFGFLRRKKQTQGTARTFVEATGGGWEDPPLYVKGDGGSQKDFVRTTLEHVREYVLERQIPVGKTFNFTIKDIPIGITSPHEIVFGCIMQANQYGLRVNSVTNEEMSITRMS